jgi:hypothetical protein
LTLHNGCNRENIAHKLRITTAHYSEIMTQKFRSEGLEVEGGARHYVTDVIVKT